MLVVDSLEVIELIQVKETLRGRLARTKPTFVRSVNFDSRSQMANEQTHSRLRLQRPVGARYLVLLL